jgi:RNA polymerase sigma-70 factor (ECF subfamily)
MNRQMDLALILMSVGPPAGTMSGPGRYMTEASDARVIKASLDGDQNATEELVRRYWDEAARAAYLIIGDKWMAEDAAQEAFISALGSLEKFDPERSFRPWLHRIAVNKAIDRARQIRDGQSLVDEPADTTELPQAEEDPRTAEALNALGDLDPEDRVILVAKYVLNYRAVEIAEWLGMPDSTVRVRLHRAAGRVRKIVNEGGS